MERIPETVDLRKNRRDELCKWIVQRAHWLAEDDCRVVLAMFRDGQSAAAIAHACGQCPRQMRKRIKQLIARLDDPRMAYVVAHSHKWTKSRQSIARALFIDGRSMRQTTNELSVSLYSVRRHRQAIESMCQGAMSAADRCTNAAQLRAWRQSK